MRGLLVGVGVGAGKRGLSSSLIQRRWRRRVETNPDRKVAILGAASSIGQRLAFLLNLNPLVSNLALYDVAGSLPLCTYGTHFTTRAQVVKHLGENSIGNALQGSDLVIVSGEPGTDTHHDPCLTRAETVKSLCIAIAKHCPHAIVNMISNPEVSIPIASEVFKEAGTYDGDKLFGMVIRHENKEMNAPSKEAAENVELATGKSLYTAYAGALIADSCLRALNGMPDTAERSFVQPENIDNVEVILSATESKMTTTDLLLERFEQWRSRRCLKIRGGEGSKKKIVKK